MKSGKHNYIVYKLFFDFRTMAFYNILYLSNENDRNLESNTVCNKGMTRDFKICLSAWEMSLKLHSYILFNFKIKLTLGFRTETVLWYF